MNAPFGQQFPYATATGAVIEAGRAAAAKGWVPATSGNFSARAGQREIAITRSGVDKGVLRPDDIFAQPLDAPLLPGSSAEAGLHLRLYRDDDAIGAIFHVHSPAATLLGRLLASEGVVRIEGWELQKALRGVASHEETIEVPVFENDQNVPELAERVAQRLAAEAPTNARRAPGYLLAGHGLYAWRHLEALETLFLYILDYRSFRP